MVLATSFLFQNMASFAGNSTAATNSKWQRSELVNTIGAELPNSRSFVSGAPHQWNVAMTLQLLSIGSLFPKFPRRREWSISERQWVDIGATGSGIYIRQVQKITNQFAWTSEPFQAKKTKNQLPIWQNHHVPVGLPAKPASKDLILVVS